VTIAEPIVNRVQLRADVRFLESTQGAREEIHADHLVKEPALGLREAGHRADEGMCLFEGFLPGAR